MLFPAPLLLIPAAQGPDWLAGGAVGTWIGVRETLWIATAGALLGVLLGVLWLLPSPILGPRELPEPEAAAD